MVIDIPSQRNPVTRYKVLIKLGDATPKLHTTAVRIVGLKSAATFKY